MEIDVNLAIEKVMICPDMPREAKQERHCTVERWRAGEWQG